MAIELTAQQQRQVRSLYTDLRINIRQYVKWKMRLDPIFGQIDSAVPQAGQILDAGCGYGLMSNILAIGSDRRQVLGVDLDKRKMRIAQHSARILGNVRFVLADLLAWEYPPAECVLLIDVLHYWSAEKQQRIIAKAAACLRDGGVLVFREGMRLRSWGHRLVHWGERWAVMMGNNPRGDGLCFQDREFYLRNFAEHGLCLHETAKEWGRGSNMVLLLRKQTR